MRIAILGPESSGKTTLARALAEAVDGVCVPEYGRAYSERFGNQSSAMDLMHIAAGQLLLEDETAASRPARPLVCDTDVLTTATFATLYLGYVPTALAEMVPLRGYDLTLLLPPTLPHVADDIRLFGNRRQEHFGLLKNGLDELGRRYHVVHSQTLEERLVEAQLALTKVKTN